MDSILKLDPNFYAAKLRNNFGTASETREHYWMPTITELN